MKFTQAELEAAYEQMRQERENDWKLGEKAAQWLRPFFSNLSIYPTHGGVLYAEQDRVTPYRAIPRLKVNYCQYDNPSRGVDTLFKDHPDKIAKVATVPIGYSRHTPFYTLDLSGVEGFPPHAKFEMYLDMFDAHSSGY